MRVRDAVLKTDFAGNQLQEGQAPLLNLSKGSQNGLHIQLGELEGNYVADQFCNAQPYTTRNTISILMQCPRAMDYYSATKKNLISSLKELVEAKPSKVNGINLKITVSTASVAFGSYLEFEEPTKTEYEKSSITMDYYEVKNKTIQRFFEFYIKSFVGNPNTQFLDAGKFIPYEATEGINTYDFRSFTTAYIEPDDFNRSVIDGCIVFNMYPKEAGENELGMDKAGERETRNYSIPFAGTAIKTNLVLKYLHEMLGSISLNGLIPEDVIMPPANGIDPTVSSTPGGFVPAGSSGAS